jgi:predicted DNA-binding transcriptional regulator AlpA
VVDAFGKKVLSVAQVAQLLGVHVSSVHRWSAEGAFAPKIRLGRSRVGFLESDVLRWLDERHGSAA